MRSVEASCAAGAVEPSIAAAAAAVAMAMATVATTAGCWGTSERLGVPDGTADGTVDTAGDTAGDPAVDWAADTPWDTHPDTALDTWPDPAEDTPWDDGDAPVPCPPHAGAWVWFDVDGSEWSEADLDLRCWMRSASFTSDGGTVYEMDCPTGSGGMEGHAIRVEGTPVLGVAAYAGQWVRFRYVAEPVWWVNRWVALYSEGGGLLLALTDASAPVPWGEDPGAWFAPVGVDVTWGLCPALADSCGMQERGALDVAFGTDASARVPDGTSGYVGYMVTAQVVAGRVTRYEEMWCEDMADEWYSVGIAILPEG